jgi:hypothetical protein
MAKAHRHLRIWGPPPRLTALELFLGEDPINLGSGDAAIAGRRLREELTRR